MLQVAFERPHSRIADSVLLPSQAHPDRNVTPRSDHLLMPFLFPAPSKAAATAAAAPSAADEEDDGEMRLDFM